MSRVPLALFPMLLAFTVGCGSDSTGPQAIAGLYDLLSLDGEPLPFLVEFGPSSNTRITAGHVQVTGDGTCSFSQTLLIDDEGSVTSETENEACTWTVSLSAISFTFPDNDILVGTVIQGTLWVVEEDIVAIYVIE